MDEVSAEKGMRTRLFAAIDPFDQRMLDVGDGHLVYVEQCGNPDGIPVVVLHGGPGGGCSPAMRRYFDPAVYRVILFDQRGCGRSRPHASVTHNTTWHLVADIELIRETLGIARWIVFGGSWGATLALFYAQEHPERVAAMALRGIFAMTEIELDWFYNGGASRFWPDLWDRFIGPIPAEERDDPIAAYHRRLFCGEMAVEIRFAKLWASWENALASIGSDGAVGESSAEYARAFSRLENHYFFHRGFVEDPDHIFNRMDRITDIPAVIVQGRFDMICPPATAYRISQKWNAGRLIMVGRAGHALSEPGISLQLVQSMQAFATQKAALRL